MMPTIRRGNIGATVLKWQNIVNNDLFRAPAPLAWINTRGESRVWSPKPLKLDGVFGGGTELASEAWQSIHGLAADGIVGPQSWFVALGGGDITGPSPLLYGVDVSAMQGPIAAKDWQAMRDKGLRFAIVRACVGNEAWLDLRAGANIAAARGAGLAVGAYCFAYPLRHIDPKQQVEQWIKRCDAAALDLGSIMWALDLEWPPREEWRVVGDTKVLVHPWYSWGVTAESIAEWALTALARAKELTGRDWLRYSFPYFLRCVEAEKYPELANGPLWLADYFAAGRWPTPEEVAAQKPPAPWTSIAILQHDGNGGLRLPNSVDADFNVLQGGEDALSELIARAPVDNAAIEIVEETAPLVPDLNVLGERQIASYRRSRIATEGSPA